VQDPRDLANDPQFQHRDHFVSVTHSVAGATAVENSRFKLSRTPAAIDRAGPALGEDNHRVLHEILGYSDERISDLVAAEVLG
jgi:crotonobetainyl-CoA:carnitine CoA-transferase CaiB-like acyl-CoA transferase